ncbi:MAG: hypothetical protein ACI4EK_05995 [Wujia sp.]
MKKQTRNRVLLTFAMLFVMVLAMNITSSAAIQNLRQTEAGSSYVTVEWVDVYQYYSVEYSTDGVNWVHSSSYLPDAYGPKETIYNLAAGCTYLVRVQPLERVNYNYVAVGTPSVIEVGTAPDDPQSLKQTNATSSSVTLSWVAPYGATAFQIVRNDAVIATVGTNSATVKATAGTRESYTVRSLKTLSNGVTIAGGSTYVYAKAAPAAPKNVASFSKGNMEWNPDKNKLEIGWTGTYYEDGFQVEVYDVTGKKKLKTYNNSRYTSSQEITLSAIKNKGCQVRVRGYIKVNDKKCYGAWSKKVVVLPQCKVNYKLNGTDLKINWTKVKNAVSYNVYVRKNVSYSDKSAMKKVASTKNTTYTIKGLKAGKYTRYYVVPVVKVNGKKVTANAAYVYRTYFYRY